MLNALEIQLLKLYDDRSRHYHGIGHILELIDLYRYNVRVPGLPDAGNLLKMSKDSDSIQYSILAHDCVYNAGRHDNEEQSAELFKNLAPLNMKKTLIDSVVEFTLASKGHIVSEDERESDKALFLSLDLSALASSREHFHNNSELIMQEYLPFYTEYEIKEGRKKFFEAFLQRPYIFPHSHLENVWGDKARENLKDGIFLL